jgi:DNA-directed RNA polymerase beta' subunit
MKTFMQIGLATSEEIQSWAERSFLINGKTYSIGEVKKADTINYRSFKPEKDGLFCERIFGPVKDWICGCGQSRLKTLKNEKKGTGDRSTPLTPQYPYLFPELKFSTKTFDYGFKDEQGKEKNDERVAGNSPSTGLFICPNCQVEVTLSRVRRYRMGYIELGCPVTHIWYLNSRPNIFSVLLKIPTKYVKKITYYRGYSPTVLSSGFDEINPRNFTQKQVLQIRSPAGSSGEATGDFPGGGPPFPLVSLAPGVFGSENPCIAPGGDFFDNEWEFLHIWFSLPRTTQKYYKVGGAKGIGFSISENSVGSQIEKPIYPPTFSPSLSTSLQGVKETTSNLNSLFSTAKDEQPSVFPELPEFNNRSNGSVQREKQEGKGLTTLTSPKLWKDKNTSQKPIRLVSSIPSWLENTGAKAFKQHFENRDWQKEFEKLHEDLRRTPIFFNEMPGGGGKPLIARYPAETSGLSVKSEFPRERVPPKTDPDPLQGGKVYPAPNHFLIYDNLLKRRKKRVRNLKLLNALRTAGGTKAFDGFIFQILPVLPPELRPIVQLSAGQFASSDVNDLYRRLISRNNRLKYYFTACGPHLVEFLVRSEQHLVQVAVDALFDGSSAASELGNLRRGGGTLSGSNATSGSKGSSSNAGVYKSLSDRIGGKQGRFRQNLLGKRVDYSGRSVIVVGPRLKMHECGLPYEMAIELFQAFILRHILELQLAKTIRGAKNLIKLNNRLD